MRHALNSLAILAPDWLRAHSRPDWLDRYGPRVEDYRLPKGDAQRQDHAQQVGTDGYALLDAVYQRHAPGWLREVPAVETLRRVWVQQYYRVGGTVHWRMGAAGLPPSALMISFPYDVDARYAKNRSTSWIGYKVHVTETCETDEPHLITHVETTPAPVADADVTEAIHTALKAKQLLPSRHIVDTGYLDAQLMVISQSKHDVELFGPTRPDYRWQAQAGQGFDASHFLIDWARCKAVCPMGQQSNSWTPAVDRRKNAVIKIKFSRRDCQACSSRPLCTRGACRTVTVRPHDQYLSLQGARQRENTEEYRQEYARRAGIEGTISQAVRAFGLRRTRYIGAAKTHLQHVLTATAINFVRVAAWLAGDRPKTTRLSSFAILMTRTTQAV